MARVVASPALAAACPQYASLKAALPFDATNWAVERAAFTHALHCGTCQPIADRIRREHTTATARIEAEAADEFAREAIPVLEQVEKILNTNGYFRHFLWDTRQAAGTPIHLCRVSIPGAIGIALYDDPRYATGPRVHAIEQLLADRTSAPSLAAWSCYPGHGQEQALELVRSAVDALRHQTATTTRHA